MVLIVYFALGDRQSEGRNYVMESLSLLATFHISSVHESSSRNSTPISTFLGQPGSLIGRNSHNKNGKSWNPLTKDSEKAHSNISSHIKQSVVTSYKPSPLGYGSPPSRSSPFRRPESPASPSPLRHTTPTISPTKAGSAAASRFARASTPTTPQDSWTPGRQASGSMTASTQRFSHQSRPVATQPLGSGNALSQLHTAQVRTLRDGFQILDRDCDGVVNRDDVTDMLSQLGLPHSASDVSQFFPPSKPQTIALAVFLNSLAETLCELSPSAELLSAFSAFDDDDSGQVDWAELRDALLNTAPEPGDKPLTAAEVDRIVNGFTGRRAFNRNINAQLGAKKGEVFKYNEFVNSITGSNGGTEGPSNDSSE
ncbi:hypothetical protein QQS21_002633 [Conoideocrella luteorostrata]|uniref:EF-hand domain-containing protein n=1 Tax=Conoideocrella luteorostrata TaxID=1105319 RepID=A0AAJ0CUT7_9HYPO|nr:hypothetical protein QQS21_002633 [Conoideocrella luteorostrata]